MNKQSVKPFPADAEPAAGAQLPASETEDEVAVGIFLERKPCFDELEMPVTLLAGVGHGVPYGKDARIEKRISLAHAGREKQISGALRKQAYRASDDFVFVADEKDFP